MEYGRKKSERLLRWALYTGSWNTTSVRASVWSVSSSCLYHVLVWTMNTLESEQNDFNQWRWVSCIPALRYHIRSRDRISELYCRSSSFGLRPCASGTRNSQIIFFFIAWLIVLSNDACVRAVTLAQQSCVLCPQRRRVDVSRRGS
jgi:hypothetical protein